MSLLSSSFRDPDGFIFTRDTILYRQINESYKEDYNLLNTSGLSDALINEGLLIPHEEVDLPFEKQENGYKVIKPDLVPFISYPYEWCFSQLREAALATLEIQKRALSHEMSLKDCSAYNIQFIDGNPKLIDTLSFEKYEDGKPWVAYRQFCQHFLAPLLLMKYCDVRHGTLSRVYLDGIPLQLASSMLPFRTRFNFSIFSHIFLHARYQQRFSDKPLTQKRGMGKIALLGLIDNLISTVSKLHLRLNRSHWSTYYGETNYSQVSFDKKKKLIDNLLQKVRPSFVWDLGANTGLFSRVASDRNILTISIDNDPEAVELNYREVITKKEKNVFPLIIDLTNPSPGIGWENSERMSLVERGPAEMVFALALIHHLAIGNNLPFEKIAHFISKTGESAIIEFIPKTDSQVQRLLSTRKDIFNEYTKENFESSFKKYYTLKEYCEIEDSQRSLYLFVKE